VHSCHRSVSDDHTYARRVYNLRYKFYQICISLHSYREHGFSDSRDESRERKTRGAFSPICTFDRPCANLEDFLLSWFCYSPVCWIIWLYGGILPDEHRPTTIPVVEPVEPAVETIWSEIQVRIYPLLIARLVIICQLCLSVAEHTMPSGRKVAISVLAMIVISGYFALIAS
jgi:hypothetical protein